jgi:L-2-hydroxyglutarate oxidase LhgO
MEQANIVIIGGGVVGCAIARALSARWNDVFLLEALPKLGMGASTGLVEGETVRARQ